MSMTERLLRPWHYQCGDCGFLLAASPRLPGGAVPPHCCFISYMCKSDTLGNRLLPTSPTFCRCFVGFYKLRQMRCAFFREGHFTRGLSAVFVPTIDHRRLRRPRVTRCFRYAGVFHYYNEALSAFRHLVHTLFLFLFFLL